MNTNIKDIAAILATAIWADGDYDEAEKIAVGSIADAFELDPTELDAAVDAALKEVEPMDEDGVNAYILDHSAEVDDEEAEMIYEAVLELVLIDGILSSEEVDNLLSIASALGVDESAAVLMLANFIKNEPELQIEF